MNLVFLEDKQKISVRYLEFHKVKCLHVLWFHGQLRHANHMLGSFYYLLAIMMGCISMEYRIVNIKINTRPELFS